MYKKISQVHYVADKGPTIILCVPNQNASNPPTDLDIIGHCKELYSNSMFDRRLMIYEIKNVDSCRCPNENQIYKTTHNHVTIKGRPGAYDEVSKTLAAHLAGLPVGEVVTIEQETRDKPGQENLNRGAREELQRRQGIAVGVPIEWLWACRDKTCKKTYKEYEPGIMTIRHGSRLVKVCTCGGTLDLICTERKT